jgi:hypothetical protein
MLLSTEARRVTALAAGADGIVFATSDKGSVGLLQKGLAKEGTYTSDAMDAKQIAKWGRMKFSSTSPAGTQLTVATRSGNVAEADDSTWSAWTKDVPVGDDSLPVASPTGRFIQFRLKFIATAAASPRVRTSQLIYQVGNLPPAVSGIKAIPSSRGKEALMGPAPAGEPEGPRAYRLVAFQATDLNGDKLIYTVAVREVGTDSWVMLAEKLTDAKYVWDTRTVADGKYELRVTASDSPSNPPETALEGSRVSEPVLVDNTAPVVKALTVKVDGAKIAVTGSAADAGSLIASIQYSVDSASEWVTVLPAGGICDDKKADFAFEVKDLKAGEHRLAVRVEDAFGNVGYGTVSVTVAKAEAKK